ncbi:MAG: hypothetical protein HYY93_10365 [Planctomycetes bacterium]|nr:hypothetical protein [Planctomycetota bacterium]
MSNEGDDGRYDLAKDTRDDDPADTLDCPACGASIYEEAERCPRCGEYATPGGSTGTPRWIFWTAVLCLLAILFVWLL